MNTIIVKKPREEDNKSIYRVIELSNSGMPITQQQEIWTNEFSKSYRTFYRIRKKLDQGGWGKKRALMMVSTDENDPRYVKVVDIKECYFCEKLARDIHHIDKNHDNSNPENLIPLCEKCHCRLHKLYDKIF